MRSAFYACKILDREADSVREREEDSVRKGGERERERGLDKHSHLYRYHTSDSGNDV